MAGTSERYSHGRFCPRRLRASERNYMVHSIFKDVTQNPEAPFELNKYFWVMTLNFISRLVLSNRYFSNRPEELSEEAEEFKYVLQEQFFLLASIFPADSFPFLERFDIGGLQKRTKALLPRFQGILTKVLTERCEQRKKEGDAHIDVDMVDVLLTNEEKGEITDLNIRGVLWDAFAGGTDTQIVTVEWAMAHILADPKIYETLRSEIDREVGVERRLAQSDLPRLKYVNAIMRETFRLHPPTPLLLPRETSKACTVAGYYIPPKTRLFVNVWAIGRNPQVWENPLEFQPERFLEGELQEVGVQEQHFNLIPFGSGRRSCPALTIGMMGVQFGIAILIHAFDWSLPQGVKSEVDMTEECGINLRKGTPLCAVAKPRLAAHLYKT